MDAKVKRAKTQRRCDEYDACLLTPLYDVLLLFNPDGADALTAFYQFDTHGKRIQCQQPDVVARWIGIKKSIHFHIKEWLAGYREGTFSAAEIEECIDVFCLPVYAAKELRQAFTAYADDYSTAIVRISPNSDIRGLVYETIPSYCTIGARNPNDGFITNHTSTY